MKRVVVFAALSALTLSGGPAEAEDFWTGFYAGIYTDQSFGQTQTKLDAGAMVGYRIAPLDGFIVGAEVEAGTTLNAGVTPIYEAFIRGVVGVPVLDNTLIYGFAAAGVAHTPFATSQMIKGGGGIEFAANEVVSLRGELYAATATTGWGSTTYYGLRGGALFSFD